MARTKLTEDPYAARCMWLNMIERWLHNRHRWETSVIFRGQGTGWTPVDYWFGYHSDRTYTGNRQQFPQWLAQEIDRLRTIATDYGDNPTGQHAAYQRLFHREADVMSFLTVDFPAEHAKRTIVFPRSWTFEEWERLNPQPRMFVLFIFLAKFL